MSTDRATRALGAAGVAALVIGAATLGIALQPQDGAVTAAGGPMASDAPTATLFRDDAATRVSRSTARPTITPTPKPKPVPSSAPARTSSAPDPTPSGFAAWRNSAKAKSVIMCESGGDYSVRSRTGKYRGAWQMDADFWRTYGGLKYAPRPDAATPHQQDLVAYRGWLSRGWQPWACA